MLCLKISSAHIQTQFGPLLSSIVCALTFGRKLRAEGDGMNSLRRSPWHNFVIEVVGQKPYVCLNITGGKFLWNKIRFLCFVSCIVFKLSLDSAYICQDQSIL